MCSVSSLLLVDLLLFSDDIMLVVKISVSLHLVCVYSFLNTCEDISVCIGSVCLVVLMPVAWISVSFYLMIVLISVYLYLVCFYLS